MKTTRAMWIASWLMVGCLYEEHPDFGDPGPGGSAADGGSDGATTQDDSASGSGSPGSTGSGADGSATAGDATGSTSDDGGSVTGADPGCEVDCPWWNEQWPSRMRIDVSLESTSIDAHDVPVVIRLEGSAADGAFLDSDGSDLRFVSPDGVTLLPHEIELWQPEQGSVLWVELPTLERGAGSLYVYFGAQEANVPAPSAWGEGFAGVWHLSGLQDSGPGKHHAGNGGGSSTSGRFAGAWKLAADGQHLDAGMGSALWLMGDATLSLWVRADELSDRHALISRSSGGGGPPHNTAYQLEVDAQGRLSLRWERGQGNEVVVSAPDETRIAVGAWHHVAAVRDIQGGTVTFFLDGIATAPIPFADPPQGGAETETWIGAEAGTGRSFIGIIDEVRVAAVAHSPSFIRAQALAGDAAVVTLGPVESY